jgi:hypothetical protein
MATYGVYGTPGQVGFTGWTNTLASGAANLPNTVGYVQNNGMFQHDDEIAKVLRNGGGSAAMKALIYTLLGASAGSTATATKKQVSGANPPGAGLPVIETVTLVNRATTAADLTAIQALFNRTPAPASYAVDLSGNGGGGHVTY